MRRTRSLVRRTAGAAAVGVVAALVLPSGAGAAGEIVDVGWWSDNPLASAPDGGFTVGATAGSPTAVAAIRLDLGGGLATLVLGATPSGGVPDLASLQVCAADDGWTAAAPGALDDAPQVDCSSPVPFAPAGGVWRADVSSLVDGERDTVSLAIIAADGASPLPFEATFGAPTAIEAVAVDGAAPTEPTPDPGSPTPPTTVPVASGGSSPPAFTPPPSSGSTFQPTPVTIRPSPPTTAAPSATLPDATGVATSIPGDGALGGGDVPFEAASGVLDLAAGEPGDARWGEAFALVLVGALVGAAVFVVSRFSAARA